MHFLQGQILTYWQISWQRAYEIKVNNGTELTAAQLTTENLILNTEKKYTVQLKIANSGKAVKGAITNQETAKALTAIEAFGNVIVDKDGEIQEIIGEETNKKKLSTITAGATDAEKAAKAKAMASAHNMAGDEYFTSKIGTKVADTIIADTASKIVGYNNAVGNHTILANQPALLKKIVLNYEADVVQQNGEWVNSPSFDTPEKQAFAMEYNLLAKNLCGSQSGKESDFSGVQEVGKCMTAYYAYVGAVTTACTTQAEEISPDCAAGFAGKLIAAYGSQFDNEGIPHLNAADEAQGNTHYEL